MSHRTLVRRSATARQGARRMASANEWPEVRRISLDDLNEAVVAGISDFRAYPGYGIAIGAAFAVAGWVLFYALAELGLPFLIYPLAMGFALVAPFAAAAFYAVSDLRERGQPVTRTAVVAGLNRERHRRDLGWMALVTFLALILWLEIAAVLTFAFGGINTFDTDYLNKLLDAPAGVVFLIIGNLAGAAIGFAVFAITVISFPMLYHRDTDFITAMVTSVRLVEKNPVTMLAWAVFIGFIVALSVMTAFLGLLILLPIIGHSTWHLYRLSVEPVRASSVVYTTTTTPDLIPGRLVQG
jgi:uncharacterized membrane protein